MIQENKPNELLLYMFAVGSFLIGMAIIGLSIYGYGPTDHAFVSAASVVVDDTGECRYRPVVPVEAEHKLRLSPGVTQKVKTLFAVG